MITESFDDTQSIINPPVNENSPKVDALTFSNKIEGFVLKLIVKE